MTTILVVEDDAITQQAVRAMLEPAGYRVICAGDGAAALAQARQSLPDLVLSDVRMPVMDGDELCRTLTGDGGTAAVPVLLMSTAEPTQAVVSGADAFLRKPFTRAALLAQVARYVGAAPSARRC
jgi:CheY-like chemotaxis protein